MRKNKKIVFGLFGLFIFAFVLILVLKSGKFTLFEQKLTVGCPVSKEFCQKGIVLHSKSGKLIGLGFKLPVGTKLNSVFSGDLRMGSGLAEGTKKYFSIVFIDGRDKIKGYTATYEFYGTPIYGMEPEKLKSGIKDRELAGYLGPDSFPSTDPFKGVNFIFSLHKGAKTTPPLPLSAFEFK